MITLSNPIHDNTTIQYCGAKKRNGEPCQNYVVTGRNRCRMHGGKTPKGINHYEFKPDKYKGRDLPARLHKAYNNALSDTELLSTRIDIATIESRVQEVFDTMDNGESGALWLHLTQLVSNYHNANENNQYFALHAILNAVEAGSKDYQAWLEIRQLLQERRLLAESERKRLVDMQQMISTEKALLLIGAVIGIIKENVTDTKTLSKISSEVGKLLNRE